ncbi:hypothetical protein BGX27_004464, partial [Mortierella sp. AM989]
RSDTSNTGWMSTQIDDTLPHHHDQSLIFGQDNGHVLLPQRQRNICNFVHVDPPLAVRDECGQVVAARRSSNDSGGSDDAVEQAVVQSSRRDVESEPVLFLGGLPIVRRGPRAVLPSRQERNSTSPSTTSMNDDKVNNA